MTPNKVTSTQKSLITAILLFGLFTLAVYISFTLSDNVVLVHLVEKLGYLGVFAIATVTGLSFFSPVPAASFTPLYSAAGLYLPAVVGVLALGTLLADVLGFLFGKTASQTITTTYPTIANLATSLSNSKRRLLTAIGIFLYASFVPLPNEALIIPLAAAGVPWRLLVIPLLLGNILHQTLLVGGISFLV